MSKKPFTYKQFKSIYSQVPRLSVDLLIPYKGGIALLERAHTAYKGQWHLPGGTVYYKESVRDAVRRIAKEETAIDVDVAELAGLIEYKSEELERGFGYTVGLVFWCSLNAIDTVVLDENSSAIKGFKKVPDNTVVEQKKFLQRLGF